MRTTLSLIALAIVLPACAGTGMFGSEDTPASTANAAMPSSSREYVAMAGASDLYEIESSRLALEKSQNSTVQQFARKMIAQHTQTTAKVTNAARTAGLTPDQPKLMPMQEDMMAELRRAPAGEAFDRTYIAQQRRAHDMALALHSGFAETGLPLPLRQVAQDAVPVVEEHIRALRTMP